jgi:uncharacterized caspase-like protein/peptidoglycan hydrolase-like protein with peptidoglycan-binding domain
MCRRVLLAIAAVWALLALPLSAGPALAEKRVALIIGNGAYQSVAKLSNPLKDANAIKTLFEKAGFDWVRMRQDVGNLEFKRALREFMDAAQDADIAVVYYAGHGIQVRDMNYMIPVDAKLATEIDAEDEAVSLDRIVAALEPAKRLRLVILDACRDNPFARTMKRRVATRALNGGLARMEPTLGDTLIAYAAKAGSTAEDGDGQNSPFAVALIKHLAVPGLDIRLAFGRVRDEVLKSTGYKQEPFVYGSLGGEAISLVPAPAQPKAEALSDVRGDYELVERIGTKKAWEAFLSSHKEGLYADLARAQMAKLQQEGAQVTREQRPANQNITVAAVEPPAPPKPSGPTTEERRAWERIRDANDRGKLQEFIAKYPASPLAETAKNRLDTLERAAQERDEKARAEREARDEKARAEREAATRREEEANRLKAEEAARQTAEREAARQREEQAKRLQTEAAARQAAEREAARQKDEEAKRLKAAEEAERKKAEREATRRREEEARLAKTAEANRKREEACRHDEDRLAALRASADQGWARADLKRLEQNTTCDHVRQEVVAVLAQPLDATRKLSAQPSSATGTSEQPAATTAAPAAPATSQVASLTPPAEPKKSEPPAPVNTRDQVLAAQDELKRIGCFAGRADGSLGNATKEAVQRYLSQKGSASKEASITNDLLTSLKGESERVCPLSCARGEHPEGDRCVADAKPEKPGKSEKAEKSKSEKPKATARQSDEDEPRRARPKREEPRREARPKPEKPERAAARPAPAPVQSPAPTVRTQASAPGRASGMIGVGF